MVRIGLVCAHLPTRNTGMFTVDKAAQSVLTRIFPEASLTYYAVGNVGRSAYTSDEMGYAYLPLHERLDELKASDIIVYWGDFLHSKSYWDTDLKKWLLEDGIATSAAAAEDIIFRTLMLEGAERAVLAKTILFGGTIITTDAVALADDRYRTALERLMSQCAGVFFRDGFSAAIADPYRGGRSALGSDCALHFDRSIVTTHSGDPADNADPWGGPVGVFFGRSRWIAPHIRFARQLARSFDCATEWIQWVGSSRGQRLVARAAGYPAEAEPRSNEKLFFQLMKCRLVVTDTYHLCVNAWMAGIPAICIGRGAEIDNHTLSDKKKEALYRMYGAAPFYIYYEDIAAFRVGNAVAKARRALRDPAARHQVVAAFDRQRAMAFEKLRATALRIAGNRPC